MEAATKRWPAEKALVQETHRRIDAVLNRSQPLARLRNGTAKKRDASSQRSP